MSRLAAIARRRSTLVAECEATRAACRDEWKELRTAIGVAAVAWSVSRVLRDKPGWRVGAFVLINLLARLHKRIYPAASETFRKTSYRTRLPEAPSTRLQTEPSVAAVTRH